MPTTANIEGDWAVFLAKGESLRIVWANREYLELLPEPYRSGAAIGKALSEVSPLAALRAEALAGVLRTGESACGEDRRFSVEEGTLVHEWHAYRPLPDHVLVVIRTTRAALPTVGGAVSGSGGRGLTIDE
jgi:hypothetical protein